MSLRTLRIQNNSIFVFNSPLHRSLSRRQLAREDFLKPKKHSWLLGWATSGAGNVRYSSGPHQWLNTFRTPALYSHFLHVLCTRLLGEQRRSDSEPRNPMAMLHQPVQLHTTLYNKLARPGFAVCNI
eukprot:scpid70707/ scgid25377/ 